MKAKRINKNISKSTFAIRKIQRQFRLELIGI